MVSAAACRLCWDRLRSQVDVRSDCLLKMMMMRSKRWKSAHVFTKETRNTSKRPRASVRTQNGAWQNNDAWPERFSSLKKDAMTSSRARQSEHVRANAAGGECFRAFSGSACARPTEPLVVLLSRTSELVGTGSARPG